ncbi:hypothetical protein [Actinokineospora bangkokensis]|uniref:Glycosyltransferase RgtA/B/C/D-like domain-containing protein n=1 Tax=Actinokineospora bangkokensis TaxID=1193682 RepID=A0A1Q9LQ84_9PSEU|nr:hypothetical protein [Actinokineospora bangkokensis]OLR94207.1 hypothetical protein BJP25_10465 [Actinokineospora bangkokensis]
MTSHRWSDRSAARLALRTWRWSADERDRATDRRLLVVAAGGALALLAAAVRFAATASPAQAGEGLHVAQVFAVARFDLLLDGAGGSPLAWLQAGSYASITDAFTRHGTALAAAREAVVVAAAVTAVLVWLLARRIGLSHWTAAAAVLVLALSPAAVSGQLAVRAENLAVPWALGGLVLLWTHHRHRGLAPDVWATVLLVVAVITAPITLLLAATGFWLVHRRGRQRLALILGTAFALGTGIGLGASAALSGLHLAGEGRTPAEWFAADPVLAVAVVAAALGGLLSHRLRPLAVGVLGLLAVSTIPGGPGSGALAVAAAPGVLLVAGGAERALSRRFRVGRHTRTRVLFAPAVLAAVCATAAALVVWPGALDAVAERRGDPGPLAAATRWLRDNLPSTPVVAEEDAWVELLRSGRDPALAVRAATCPDATAPEGAWLLRTPGLDRGFPAGEVVAAFGTGAERVTIARPSAAHDADADAEEAQARTRAGYALAGSRRVAARPEVAALLRDGRADPRLLTTLAALASSRPVRVAALPEVAGEDAAGQPRRQLLVTAAGEQADQIALYFSGQRGVYRPLSVTTTPDGVLVRYPPGAPAGLLTPFDNP